MEEVTNDETVSLRTKSSFIKFTSENFLLQDYNTAFELPLVPLPLTKNMTIAGTMVKRYNHACKLIYREVKLQLTNNDVYIKSICCKINGLYLDKNGDSPQQWFSSETKTFVVKEKNFAEWKFETSRDDRMRENCEIIILQVEEVRLGTEKQTPNYILQAYSRMFKDDTLKDVKFLIDKETVAAHKFVLMTRSEVFSAMFTHDTQDKNKGLIRIEDTDVKIFKTFLKYLYTDEIEDIEETVDDLLVLADKYYVNDLKVKCEEYISDHLDENNSVDYLIKAYQYNCEHLKKTALLSTKFYMKNILDKNGLDALKSHQDAMMDIAGLHADEDSSVSAKRLKLDL